MQVDSAVIIVCIVVIVILISMIVSLKVTKPSGETSDSD